VSDFVVRRWDLTPYPGDQAPPHVHHGSDEAFCVLRGRLGVLVGQERRILEQGDFAVVPAGTAHTFATVGDEGAQILVVMTEEIDSLIQALHSAATPEEQARVWTAHNAALVDQTQL